MQIFISKLNWRQIIIHLAATWFFIYAFQTLAYLRDISMADIIRREELKDNFNQTTENGVTISRLLTISLWIGFSGTIGLFVAFIVSLLISFKRHWYWVNSVIVLLVAYLLNWFGLTGWIFLKQIFLTPGQIFSNSTIEFLVNGLLLLTIGILLFSLSVVNRFIGAKRLTVA